MRKWRPPLAAHLALAALGTGLAVAGCGGSGGGTTTSGAMHHGGAMQDKSASMHDGSGAMHHDHSGAMHDDGSGAMHERSSMHGNAMKQG